MINFRAVRRAYRSPPPPDHHVPTVEERIAAFERQRVRQAEERGLDPETEGYGEHRSLIGGRGKPPTRFEGGRRAEDMVRMAPMPLPWFDHENAHYRTRCPSPTSISKPSPPTISPATTRAPMDGLSIISSERNI